MTFHSRLFCISLAWLSMGLPIPGDNPWDAGPWPKLLGQEPLADADIPLQWAKACLLNMGSDEMHRAIDSHEDSSHIPYDTHLGDVFFAAFRIYPTVSQFFSTAFSGETIGAVEFTRKACLQKSEWTERHARTAIATGRFRRPKAKWIFSNESYRAIHSESRPEEADFFFTNQDVLSALFSHIPESFQSDGKSVMEVIRAFAQCRGMWIQDMRPESEKQWKGGYRDPEKTRQPPRGIWIESPHPEAEEWSTVVIQVDGGWRVHVTLTETDACQCFRYVFSLRDSRLTLDRAYPLSASYDWFLDMATSLRWFHEIRHPASVATKKAKRVDIPSMEAILSRNRCIVVAEMDSDMQTLLQRCIWLNNYIHWADGRFPYRFHFPVLVDEGGAYTIIRTDEVALSILFSEIPEPLLENEESVRSLVELFAASRAKWVQDIRPVSPDLWRGRLDERDAEQYAIPYGPQFDTLLERQRQGLSIHPDLVYPPPGATPSEPENESLAAYHSRRRKEGKAFLDWFEAYTFLQAIGTDEDWETKVERLPDGWRIRAALASMDCRATVQYTFLIRDRKMSVEKRVLLYSPFTEETPQEMDREFKTLWP